MKIHNLEPIVTCRLKNILKMILDVHEPKLTMNQKYWILAHYPKPKIQQPKPATIIHLDFKENRNANI